MRSEWVSVSPARTDSDSSGYVRMSVSLARMDSDSSIMLCQLLRSLRSLARLLSSPRLREGKGREAKGSHGREGKGTGGGGKRRQGKEARGKAKGKGRKGREAKRAEGRKGVGQKGSKVRSDWVSVSPARTDSDSSGYIQNERSSHRSAKGRKGMGSEG